MGKTDMPGPQSGPWGRAGCTILRPLELSSTSQGLQVRTSQGDVPPSRRGRYSLCLEVGD